MWTRFKEFKKKYISQNRTDRYYIKKKSKILKLYKAGYLAYFIFSPLPLFHTKWNLVHILFIMKIVLYFRCYRSDPDLLKKVPDPDPHPWRQYENNVCIKFSFRGMKFCSVILDLFSFIGDWTANFLQLA